MALECRICYNEKDNGRRCSTLPAFTFPGGVFLFHSHSSKEPADFSQERYAHTDDPSYQMPQSDDSDFGGRKKFSIFRPRLSKPNLLISICINTLRLFALVIVLGGLALAGAVMGIA